MIKGFIFDIDETIFFRKFHKAPNSTIRAIKKLRQKGYKIAVCTAREKAKLKTVAHELLEYVDFVVVGAGSMAYKDHYLYWANLIKEDDLNKYVTYINEHNLTYDYSLEDGKTYYYGEIDFDSVKRVLDWSARMPKMRKIRKTDKVVSINFRKLNNEDIKYLYSVNKKAKPIIWSNSLFMCGENIDKVTGIDLFCDAYGFNRNEICAFGDGSFDASMVTSAKMGVAIKGSKLDEMKLAKYTTSKSAIDGGVYEFLVEQGFIERDIPDIKIFFFDIDSTTYDHSIKDVRKSTVKALKQLHQNNIKTCIATSRSTDEMAYLPKALLENMDGVITCAGALSKFEGITITRTIDYETGKRILKFLDENKLTYRYVTKDDHSYLNKHDEKSEKLFFEMYHMVPKVKEYEGEQLIHILYHCQDKKLINRIQTLAKNCSNIDFILAHEISAKGTDKSLDMLRLAYILGYEKENVGAFGDSFNDVQMLEKAEIGFCLGNGKDEAKLAADYVCEDISDDGLYKALVKYGYIKG